jgi:hypothetical protein
LRQFLLAYCFGDKLSGDSHKRILTHSGCSHPCYCSCHAVLVSSGTLGTFALGGSANIIGDIATGANNADWDPGVVSSLDRRNELVYEFSTSETLLAQVTSNTLTGDPDFFLLSNLDTTPDGALNLADGALGATFLDGALGATESLYLITAGTYFLSIDSYGVGTSASFDINLNFATAPFAPVASLDLGILGDDSTPLTLDTLTSTYDTELAIFDEGGQFALVQC